MLLNVDSDSNGQRLDNFLIKTVKNIPKSRIYRMVRKGEVRVNSKRVKPFTKIYQGDSVRVPPLSGLSFINPTTKLPTNFRLTQLVNENISVIFENDDIVILDKPAGISVHGVTKINTGLLELVRIFHENNNLKLCHRLDKDTSGLLIVSKKRSSLLNIQNQLKNGEVNKKYLAVCLIGSHSTEIPSEVCMPLLRTFDRHGNRLVKIDEHGKYALTKLRELIRVSHQTFGLISLIECIPITGRTHQIRVHLSSLGLPILGDKRYHGNFTNGITAERMFLHAWKLSFRNFGEARKSLYVSPMPAGFRRVLKGL